MLLTPITLFFNFWCDACSISAIGVSNGKNKLAKYFQNSYTLEGCGGLNGEGGLNFMTMDCYLKGFFLNFNVYLVGMVISIAHNSIYESR